MNFGLFCFFRCSMHTSIGCHWHIQKCKATFNVANKNLIFFVFLISIQVDHISKAIGMKMIFFSIILIWYSRRPKRQVRPRSLIAHIENSCFLVLILDENRFASDNFIAIVGFRTKKFHSAIEIFAKFLSDPTPIRHTYMSIQSYIGVYIV